MISRAESNEKCIVLDRFPPLRMIFIGLVPFKTALPQTERVLLVLIRPRLGHTLNIRHNYYKIAKGERMKETVSLGRFII